MVDQIKDKQAPSDQMLIIEKHEQVIAYLYPIVQRTPRKHGVVRDKMLACLFDQADLVIQAGKSGHVSKLYAADANLAMLRFYIRFYRGNIENFTQHNEEVALSRVAEVGNLLGKWIQRKKGN